MRGTRVAVVGLVLLVAGGLGSSAAGQTGAPDVVQLDMSGTVDPFAASYLDSAIEDVNGTNAAAILITIDTPGGLISSTREITEAILASDIPVITYVSPSGARAASAGTFILLSAPVAAMAPGTNVGAAHPVGVSGVVEEEKATNDAAASIRSLAETYDRNADWAEQAVRESVSISAEEALDEDVIDLIAPDVRTLLEEVDGRTVQLAGGQTVTLETSGATVTERGMNPLTGFLHALLDPNIAFIFFWFGLGLIILEFFAPGGIAGTFGGIMFVLSLVAFGMLPIQPLGIALLILSVVLFVIELNTPGTGLPAIGGGIALVAGGLLLFDPSVPNAQVSPWVIVPVAVLAALFFTFVIRAAIQMRHRPSSMETKQLIGATATVRRALDPEGVVLVDAEEWTAEAPSYVAVGEKVRITAVDGLRLTVEPATPRPEPTEERSTT